MFSFSPAFEAAKGGQGPSHKVFGSGYMEGGGQRTGGNKEMSSILADQ
jgi:hypothetical protein